MEGPVKGYPPSGHRIKLNSKGDWEECEISPASSYPHPNLPRHRESEGVVCSPSVFRETYGCQPPLGRKKTNSQQQIRQTRFHSNIGHASCTNEGEGMPRTPNPGGPIRTFLVSLLGAATLTAGLLLVRHHQKGAEEEARSQVPAGERMARNVSLKRLRELGL